jgi:hypothetical protein
VEGQTGGEVDTKLPKSVRDAEGDKDNITTKVFGNSRGQQASCFCHVISGQHNKHTSRFKTWASVENANKCSLMGQFYGKCRIQYLYAHDEQPAVHQRLRKMEDYFDMVRDEWKIDRESGWVTMELSGRKENCIKMVSHVNTLHENPARIKATEVHT